MNFRDAAFEQIEQLMLTDDRIIILTNDMGAFGLDKITKSFPERVINAGIAEQNIMSVAAGLAMAGKRVFVYGIAAHITKRCYEQIALDICSHDLPVIILGMGGGLSYASDGPTHHSNSDIALMATIPNISIYDPSDASVLKASISSAYGYHPAYIRIDKDDQPTIETPYDELSGLRVLQEGDFLIITSGILTHRALAISKTLASEGLKVGVVDVCRLKPFDYIVMKAIIGPAKRLLVVEEQTDVGHLGSLIEDCMRVNNLVKPLEIISLNDRFYYGATTRPYIHEKYGLTEQKIIESIKS